ncbi:Putative multidrug export ATP-binding/permease protein [Lonepinella sp. MS14434]|uniref:ABC transporter ATP-binding protein n=1 Tax=Lonepinella sp. MS14434 TaxID=3003617 RepID=UPI0036DCBDF8
MSTRHAEICRPVEKQLRFSMLLASLAQLMKLLIWLLMIGIVYEVGQEQFPLFYLLGLFVLTVVYYTLKIKSHDESHYAAFQLEQILRERLSQKIASLPLGQVQNIGSGALSKVLIDDVHELHTFVADAPPLKAEAYSTPVFVLLTLAWFNWQFALSVLLFAWFILLVLKLLFARGKLFRRQYGLALAQINSAIIEYVQGMGTVRTFDAGESSYGRFQAALAHFQQIMTDWLAKVGFSTRLARTLFTPMPMMIFILCIGSLLYWQNIISTFTLFAFFVLATGLIETMHPYMSLFHLMEKSRAAIERINEIEAMAALPVCGNPQTPAQFDLEFRQVSFHYAQAGSLKNQQSAVLNQVDFSVPQNSFTAIIGESGSGKTTLLSLLLRFWDVTGGEICIGGVNIKAITPEKLMSLCSVVFQDNFLFSGSIAENICYGLDNVSEQDMINAAQQAHIHDFIMSLPQGYQTSVGERGQLLSGGQKQRLTIARAFLQNRPILLLDEPTAYSDIENELKLMQAFNNLMQNKTVLMVAHRLSNVVNADQIIYLQKGQIAAQGKHQDLLAQSPVYQQLWQAYQQANHWVLEMK